MKQCRPGEPTISVWCSQAVEHGRIDHLDVLKHFTETFNATDFKGRRPMDIAKSSQVKANLRPISGLGIVSSCQAKCLAEPLACMIFWSA